MLLHNVSAFESDYSESAAPLAAEAEFGMTVTSKILTFLHYLHFRRIHGCFAVLMRPISTVLLRRNT